VRAEAQTVGLHRRAGQLRKRVPLIAQVAEIRMRQGKNPPGVGAGDEHPETSGAFDPGNRLERHRFEETEDRDVRPDTEREHGDDD
jgi:hypothetical protein